MESYFPNNIKYKAWDKCLNKFIYVVLVNGFFFRIEIRANEYIKLITCGKTYRLNQIEEIPEEINRLCELYTELLKNKRYESVQNTCDILVYGKSLFKLLDKNGTVIIDTKKTNKNNESRTILGDLNYILLKEQLQNKKTVHKYGLDKYCN